MKKLIGMLMITVVTVFMVSGSTDVSAQSKKSTTKNGTIELIHSKDGKYRFSVRDADGKYLAGSPVGHETEKEAREVVEELKKVLASANYVSKKTDSAKDAKDK